MSGKKFNIDGISITMTGRTHFKINLEDREPINGRQIGHVIYVQCSLIFYHVIYPISLRAIFYLRYCGRDCGDSNVCFISDIHVNNM